MVWTTIPDADIDPDSPITTSLMTAYRDNFAAMAAKDAGAPVLANDYINSAMIATDAVGSSEIAANAVGQSEIAANSVGNSEIIKTVDSSGVQAIAASGSWTPAAGFYNWVNVTASTNVVLSILVSGTWRKDTSVQARGEGFFYTDGTNMRLEEIGGTATANVYFQKRS